MVTVVDYRDKIIHKYMGRSFWTMCGRYVDTTEGLMNVVATDKDHEVNCLACRRYIDE